MTSHSGSQKFGSLTIWRMSLPLTGKSWLLVFAMALLILFSLSVSQSWAGETPEIEWKNTFNIYRHCEGQFVQQTNDGGYVVVGKAASYGSGKHHLYLVKTDADGNKLWENIYGGHKDNYGNSVQQTSDGGFIIVGGTESFGAGETDVYLIKTDAGGNTLWVKTFGGSLWDSGESVQQTSDGGYIIVGRTESLSAGNNDIDVYLIKTDATGNSLWEKSFGKSGRSMWDYGNTVQQTSDGGYIIVGHTGSFSKGEGNVYLIKTDVSGNKLWEKELGYQENKNNNGTFVRQTGDGGYIIAGSTSFYSGDAFHDVYLVKTDAYGNKLWDKAFGGEKQEIGLSVQLTEDGGYIVGGNTGPAGIHKDQTYLVKTDASGNKLWEKIYDGTDIGTCNSLLQFDDYCVAAGTLRTSDTGDSDVYLLKLKTGKPAVPQIPSIKVLFNGNHLSFEVPPVVNNGCILVPLKSISEALKINVHQDDKERIISLNRNGEIIRLEVGEAKAYTKFDTYQLDAPVDIVDGCIMVPLRFICELFGAKIDWNNAEQAMLIKFDPENKDWINNIRITAVAGYSDEQLGWALATRAVYNRLIRNTDYDFLGSTTEGCVWFAKEGLRHMWGINNREDALRIIKWLKEEGHRKDYDYLAGIISNISEERYNQLLQAYSGSESRIETLKFVKEHHKEIGGKSLIGWDLCRLVNVLEDCYIAGYISAEEAWEEIMPAAKIIQNTFTSWEDMGNNYLLGRIYWSGEDDKERSEAIKWLVTNPESPWVKYNWNLSLDKK